MSRYIDADALTAEFHRLTLGENSLIERFFADGVYAVIDTFPTADVEPVRHGHWIYHEIVSTDEGLIGAYECSVCHAAVPEAVFDFLMEGFHKNYCGACGAKMDGKENEHDKRNAE